MNDEAERPALHRMAADVGEDAPLLSGKVFFSGVSFALFGLLGLTLSLTLFPLFYLLPLGRQRRKRWSRAVLGEVFPRYIRFMELCRLIKVSGRDLETLRGGGKLIVANHPSLLDVVYLMATVENANCLVKPSLFYNPFTAGAVYAAGYIRNDSDTLFEECAASLAAGDSLIIFPEGTRTDPNRPFRFLRGAANIALAAGCPIWPVTIRCRPARLMKHQAWYEMSTETLQVELVAGPPLAIGAYLASELPRSRVARVLTRDLEALYSR